jgi:L-Ala-D/L-Glu epimerase
MKGNGSTTTPVRIARMEWFPIRIPLPRPLQWASLRETAVDYVLLKITGDNGLIGVAEGSVKVPWTGATLRSLMVAFEEMFEPAMRGVDLLDEGATLRAIRRPREHTLAKAMIDVACWDIRSQIAGQPLWRLWGGTSSVPVCWVITRQPPAVMAREAEDMAARYGFRAFKVKGGQGVATDLEALAAIRSAVGGDVDLTVDANGHYSAAETPDYVAQLADRSIRFVEDPCRYEPTAAFSDLQALCRLPLLVDGPCRDVLIAKLFLERGARGLSIKVGKSGGYSDNRAIIDLAAARDCAVNVGILTESSLGSLAALQLQAAIPPALAQLPAETTFFLMLDREYVQAPLRVVDGAVHLPDEPGMARAIDWRQVASLAP